MFSTHYSLFKATLVKALQQEHKNNSIFSNIYFVHLQTVANMISFILQTGVLHIFKEFSRV